MFCLFITVDSLRSDCREPTGVKKIQKKLQSKIKDNYINYMSFFNVKSILEKVNGQLVETFDTSNVTTLHSTHEREIYISRIYGESRCKRKRLIRPGKNHTASEMSSCPWFYMLEVDNDRIPLTVLKAQCSCRNCLVPTSYGYKRDKNGSGGYCEEVSYHMPVIRRHCVDNVYRYRIAIEKIPVGCTCQRCSRKKK